MMGGLKSRVDPYLVKRQRFFVLRPPLQRADLGVAGIVKVCCYLFFRLLYFGTTTKMSDVPAWKQAILARKKQQEETEKKKQQEKEQYYASLPPWKRAMMKKKEDGAGSSLNAVVKDVKEDHSSSRSSPLIKPKIERSVVPTWKQKTEASKEKNETPIHNGVSSKPTENKREEVSKPKGITQNLKGKFEQTSVHKVETVTVKPPVMLVENIEKKGEKPPDVVEKEEQLKPSEENKTSPQRVQKHFEKPSQKPQQHTQPASIDIDDEKFKAMPKWKQDLLLRKRQQKQQPSSMSRSPQTSPNVGHKKPLNTVDKKRSISLPHVSIGTSHSTVPRTSPTSKSPPISPFEKDKPKEVPEVVNVSSKGDPNSPKLLHKEGKELKPPVYKVKSKWADMDENDPEFQNLPEWKRTLILRRKSDFKNRTAPPKKEEKPKEEVKNEPLPAPLWTPTRSVNVVREVPKETEKVEEVNPLLDMRKNLRKVNRPKSPSQRREESSSQPLSVHNMKSDTMYNEKNDEREAEESLSPLKSPKKDKPRKVDTTLALIITCNYFLFCFYS